MYLDVTLYNGHHAILHRPESYYEDSETASSAIGRLVISLLYIISSGISVLFVSRMSFCRCTPLHLTFHA